MSLEATLTASLLTGAETTIEVTTSVYNTTSWSSSLNVYFEGAVMVIGFVGTAANSLILHQGEAICVKIEMSQCGCEGTWRRVLYQGGDLYGKLGVPV